MNRILCTKMDGGTVIAYSRSPEAEFIILQMTKRWYIARRINTHDQDPIATFSEMKYPTQRDAGDLFLWLKHQDHGHALTHFRTLTKNYPHWMTQLDAWLADKLGEGELP